MFHDNLWFIFPNKRAASYFGTTVPFYINFRSLAIFEDQEQINRKVLARFSDVSEKQYSSLGANRERIKKYLNEMMS